ncbi:MAG TPA: hypothetical protein PLX55_02870 [bacterium]|nr:hypothetical protein [bacterium]
MKIFKKIFILLSLFLLMLLPSQKENCARAESSLVNLYFFEGDGCAHCAAERKYLTSLEKEHSWLNVVDLEVTKNKANIDILKKTGEALKFPVTGVPVTVIGSTHFTGWPDDSATKELLKKAIFTLKEKGDPDIVGKVINGDNGYDTIDKGEISSIRVPFLGEVEIKNLSLPVLTALLGTIDGFNPCAMWVFLFLITMLYGLHNRLKMWVLGLAFIVASSFVYFMFMVAWLNLVQFLGVIFWVRLAIGALALGAGFYNIKEFYAHKDGVCKVTSGAKQQKILDSIKNIVSQKIFLLSLLGIVLLAFVLNLVELVCSVGLPVIYTQALSMSNLPSWQYYGYILLYIFFFMLDDIIVFSLAMVAMRSTLISTKYARMSHLVGGLILLAIGVLMIFKPELLSFS